MQRIVVDWGSSNFRAYRFGAAGQIVERREAAAGILTVADGAFEAVLIREIGDWMTPGSEIYLSGMITSRNGWVETPYVGMPTTLADLARQAVMRESAGATLRFLPGIAARHPTPDVMRGEEIQVFGAVAPGASAVLVLPGTHSKWVTVTEGRITGFRSFMTGESFALYAQHSMVGRLIPPDASTFNEAAFLAGVRQGGAAGSAGLLNDLFTLRAGALLGAFPPHEIADRLSGLLVGHEIKAGLAFRGEVPGPLLIVGETGLAARYRLALAQFQAEAEIAPADAAVEGFRRLIALLEAR